MMRIDKYNLVGVAIEAQRAMARPLID